MLLAEQGKTDKEIAKTIGCSINCVANLRKRFATNGFERALYDAPRSGAPTKFSEKQLAAVVALANEPPPNGVKNWTLDKLCKAAVSRGIVSSISIGKMHQLLKLNGKDENQVTSERAEFSGQNQNQ